MDKFSKVQKFYVMRRVIMWAERDYDFIIKILAKNQG